MRIGIIGAGITGLSAAYELAKKGHDVVVFERSSVPGGLGTYIPMGRTFIERYYHHFFSSHHFVKHCAKELGIANKLKFYPAKTSVFIDNRQYPFNPSDLLSYEPLSLLDRIRCGATTGFLKLLPREIASLDAISATEWVHRFAGTAVYDKLWGPLLVGKFSQFASSVPALWLWGRIHDRSFQLGYVDGSVKILFDQLVTRITDSGGMVMLNANITGIKTKRGKVILFEGKKTHAFDRILATPVSPIAEALFQDPLPRRYRNRLRAIDHIGVVCLILELSHRVQDAYWVNICQKEPVLVMIEHTNMIPPTTYQGRHVIYLANYIHRLDPRFRESDKAVLQTYTSILKKMNTHFSQTWIRAWHIARVPRAQTIFGLHSLDRKPAMVTPIPNVFLANIDQMYPHDRNLDQGIELGIKAAEEMASMV